MDHAATQNQNATHDLPVQYRAASFVPSTYNQADNTIDVVFTTGARRRAYDWWNDTMYEEELVVEPGAVNMARFEAGTVQVLDNHNTWAGVAAILGVATRGEIVNGEGRATVRLGQRDEIRGVVQDIINGTIRAISFGYSVERYEITRAQDRTDGINLPLYRAVAWTPMEISFVTVPADGDASTRQNQPQQQRGGAQTAPCVFQFRAAAQTTGDHSMHPDQNAAGGAQPTPTQQRAAEPAPAAPAPAVPAVSTAAAAQAAAAPAGDDAQRAADAANARAADITALCARHGVAERAAEFIRGGQSIGDVSRAILETLAVRDAATGGHRNVGRVTTVTDELETRHAGMAEAMAHRVDARTQLTDNGRQFRGMSLLELGRDMLERGGINTRGMDRMTLAREMLAFRSGGMMGSGDFANLLSNVANRRLRSSYEENPGTYGRWARRAPNAPDFKNITVVQLGAMPDLLKVNEHGEFKYGKFVDGAETYALSTFGIICSLTRQAIVNDDLRGFDRMVSGFGAASARLENRTVYAQLTANAALSADGVALFHANHGNLGTGSGSALSFNALKAGRTAMRKQKGAQSEELNLAPAFLIGPSDLEQDMYQLTSNNYVPATQAAVNEFRTGGRTAVEPIVEPVLDGNSTTAWYLAANSAQVDTVEYCWLDGAEGPVIEQDKPFEVDGVAFKCRLDFVAKAIDYRGLYKAAGA